MIIQMLQRNGIKFNYEAFNEVVIKKKETDQQILSNEINLKLGTSNLNLDDVRDVIKALYNNDLNPESLSFEFLVKHKDQDEIYKSLLKYKKIKQFLHLYRDNLATQIGNDGRIHGTWSIDGAKTGRMTCSKPNLQGFPNIAKEYFEAEEGNVFIIGDYSQIEPRVLAEMADEINMITSFIENRDIHSETASAIFQKDMSQIDEKSREVGKRINCSQIYGASSYGLLSILQKEGIDITLTQANYIRNSFYKKYPRILKFHNELLTCDEISSLGGRTWTNIPKGDGKRLNLPVQASAAEGFKEALNFLVDHLGVRQQWKLVNVVHDEIVLEVPENDAEEAKNILEQCMKKGMETILKKVPVVVDMKVQKNWKK